MRKHSILIALFTILFTNVLLGKEQADDESEPYTAYSSSADTNHPCNLAIDGRKIRGGNPLPMMTLPNGYLTWEKSK